MQNVSEIFSGNQGNSKIVLIIIGIVATILIIIVITVVSKREIEKALKEQEMKDIELSINVNQDLSVEPSKKKIKYDTVDLHQDEIIVDDLLPSQPDSENLNEISIQIEENISVLDKENSFASSSSVSSPLSSSYSSSSNQDNINILKTEKEDLLVEN